MPPPHVTRFADINDTEDEYEPSPPPAPHSKRLKGQSGARLYRVEVFVKGCERCQKGTRDCVVGEVGAACVGCKTHKYKCNKTGQRKEETMVVTRPESDSDSEVEVVSERKGKGKKKQEAVEGDRKAKRRRGGSLERPKKAREVKVKLEKVEIPKERKEQAEKPRPRPTGRKSRAKAAVKTPAVVVSSGSEEEAMLVDVEDSEEEVPKTKRARLIKGTQKIL